MNSVQNWDGTHSIQKCLEELKLWWCQKEQNSIKTNLVQKVSILSWPKFVMSLTHPSFVPISTHPSFVLSSTHHFYSFQIYHVSSSSTTSFIPVCPILFLNWVHPNPCTRVVMNLEGTKLSQNELIFLLSSSWSIFLTEFIMTWVCIEFFSTQFHTGFVPSSTLTSFVSSSSRLSFVPSKFITSLIRPQLAFYRFIPYHFCTEFILTHE